MTSRARHERDCQGIRHPREALYKALRPDAQPRFDTVNRVCAALGVKLAAQAVHT